jgi:hypothetical protein
MLFHGYTSKHCALESVCPRRVVAVLAGPGSFPDRSASVLGEPALCAIVESARAWRERMWVALVDLVRASIERKKLATVPGPAKKKRRARPRSHDVQS